MSDIAIRLARRSDDLWMVAAHRYVEFIPYHSLIVTLDKNDEAGWTLKLRKEDGEHGDAWVVDLPLHLATEIDWSLAYGYVNGRTWNWGVASNRHPLGREWLNRLDQPLQDEIRRLQEGDEG